MCRVDDAEPCDVYTDVMRTARMEHRCSECSATIHSRERYEHVTMLYDGHWATFKTCLACIDDRGWLVEQCGGFLHGEVQDELVEHWQEREFGDDGPLALARRIVGMRRRRPGNRPVLDPAPWAALLAGL